jgi:hypothetical protein
MMKKLVLVALLCVMATNPVYGAQSEWKQRGENWCLFFGNLQLCLPDDFAPTSVTRSGVYFKKTSDPQGTGVSIEFNYGCETSSGTCQSMPDIFLLRNRTTFAGVNVSDYTLDPEHAPVPRFSHSVLQFAEYFSIHISGVHDDRVSNIKNFLLEQVKEAGGFLARRNQPNE